MDRRRDWDDGHRERSPERRDRRMKSPPRDRDRARSPLGRLPRDPYDDYPPPPPKREHLPYKILCVANLFHKASDGSIRDQLMREFARFGDVSVKVCHDGNERFAYVYFRSYEEAREARHAKARLILFDKPVEVDPIYERLPPRRRSLTPDYGPPPPRSMRGPSPGRRLPPPNHHSMRGREPPMYSSSRSHPSELHHREPPMSRGEYSSSQSNSSASSQQRQQRESKKEKFPNYLHHIAPEEDDKSTRTLFVGNLEVTITDADLRRIFERYGQVEDIDVKRPPPGQGNAYAFIKFLNLDMAHRAKVEMSGQYIGKFQCKIGYGKATPTTRIWVGGLGAWTNMDTLEREFDRFGAIRRIDYQKNDPYAYIQYDSIDAAQAACQEMRGYPLGGADKRLRVDFADPGPFLGSPQASAPAPASDDPYLSADAVRRSPERGTGDGWSDGVRYRGECVADGREFGAARTANNGRDFAGDDGKRDNGGAVDWFEDQASPNGQRKRPAAGDADAVKKRRSSPDVDDGEQHASVVISDTVSTIQELVKCCPQAWLGGLILKNNAFAARALLCAGDAALVDQLMKPSAAAGDPMLRITQRLRLDPAKLEDVSRRMNTGSGYAMLLTVSSPNAATNATGDDGNAVQQRPLRNLVIYLKQKEAAGVISLTATGIDGKESAGVLYAFPPCPFASDLLRRVAPNLNTDAAKDDYLVVVVVRGSN